MDTYNGSGGSGEQQGKEQGEKTGVRARSHPSSHDGDVDMCEPASRLPLEVTAGQAGLAGLAGLAWGNVRHTCGEGARYEHGQQQASRALSAGRVMRGHFHDAPEP